MKKVFTIFTILVSASFLFGFGKNNSQENIQRVQVATSIAQTISVQEDQEKFLECTATKDPSVAKILADKDKREHLEDLPLQDLKNIDKVTKECSKPKE